MQRQKALAAARKRRYYSVTALKKCFEIVYSCVLLFQTAFPAAPEALFSRREKTSGILFPFYLALDRAVLRNILPERLIMPHVLRFSIIPLLAAFLAGCIFSSGDKGGKEKPASSVPAIAWISISDGQIFSTRNITVSWKGNEHACLFQYTIDGVFSSWIDSTSCMIADLADGVHTFSVQAANDSLAGDPVIIRFDVEAGAGPGTRFSPDEVSGAAFVSLFLEDMGGIMAAHIEIACEDSCARMKEFAPSAVFNGGVLVYDDSRDPFRLILDIGFPGLSHGFSGTMELGSFMISPVKTGGTVVVDPKKTVFRDTRNRTVQIDRFEALRVTR